MRWSALCATGFLLALISPSGMAATPTPVPTRPASASRPSGVFFGSTTVSSIRLLVRFIDATGKPVTGIRPDEVRVFEDGSAVEVTGLDPFVLPSPLPASSPTATFSEAPTTHLGAGQKPPSPSSTGVTILFQDELLSQAQKTLAIRGLEREAARLVELGPVRVVVTDPTPEVVAPAVVTEEGLTRALQGLRHRVKGPARIERIRRRYQENIRGASPFMIRVLAQSAAREEELVIRQAIERLKKALPRNDRGNSGVLLLVSGGFDEDPYAYYGSFVAWADEVESGSGNTAKRPPGEEGGRPGFGPESGAHNPQGGHPGGQREDPSSRMATNTSWEAAVGELSGAGWTIVAYTGGASLGPLDSSVAAETSGNVRFRTFMSSQPRGPGRRAGTLLLHPLDPIRHAAEVSGGVLALSPDQLNTALTGLRSASVISYSVSRSPDEAPHEIRVTTTRAGVLVHAPTVIRSRTRGSVDRLRALELLAGGSEDSDFPVTAHIDQVTGSPGKGYTGRLIVEARLARLLPLLLQNGQPAMALTVVVDTGSDTPFISAERPMPLRLANQEGDWIYESAIAWPGTAHAVAVVVSEITTDVWGGSRIGLLDSGR